MRHLIRALLALVVLLGVGVAVAPSASAYDTYRATRTWTTCPTPTSTCVVVQASVHEWTTSTSVYQSAVTWAYCTQGNGGSIIPCGVVDTQTAWYYGQSCAGCALTLLVNSLGWSCSTNGWPPCAAHSNRIESPPHKVSDIYGFTDGYWSHYTRITVVWMCSPTPGFCGRADGYSYAA